MEAHPGHWRRMAWADLVSVQFIGDLVHPTYHEDPKVIAERLQLYPAGCFVLECGPATQGYAVGHPWLFGCPPALNTQLQALPAHPDTFYIHDVALMPEVRRSHFGRMVVQLLVSQAELGGFNNMSLVAVGGSLCFWKKNGFRVIEGEAIRAALSTYGEGAAFMTRSLRKPG